MTATRTIEGIDVDRLLLAAARSPVASIMERGIDHGGGRGRPTLLAVSGGIDSTAMLVLAAALRERRREPVPGPLVIGHVDHALRASSVDDAAHVGRLGQHLGIEVVVRRLDWSGGGDVSVATAREARWEALAGIARSRGLEVLLLAHHGDDQAETVDAAALRRGDVCLVAPGLAVPADGVVVRGASTVDESMLTGEARPVPKSADPERNAVYGGTVNLGPGALRVQVVAVGAGPRGNQPACRAR